MTSPTNSPPAWPEDRGNWMTPNGNPTRKWRGRSITALRGAQARTNEAYIARRAAARMVDQCENDLQKEVEALLGVSVILGGHECDESPTVRCVYRSEDTLKDNCVFCGDPSERN